MTFDAKIIRTEREGEVDIRVRVKGVSFYRNCGAASVGVLQDSLVLST